MENNNVNLSKYGYQEQRYPIDTTGYKQLRDYNIEYQMAHQKEFNFLQPLPNDLMSTTKTYPHSDEFEFSGQLEIINYDKACEEDLREGNGFIVEPAGRNIKKDLNAEDGIFSPKFGQTLADTNPFMDRYRCRCKEGGLRGRNNAGLRCPKCGHLCSYVDDNFNYRGWIKLSEPLSLFILPSTLISILSLVKVSISRVISVLSLKIFLTLLILNWFLILLRLMIQSLKMNRSLVLE